MTLTKKVEWVPEFFSANVDRIEKILPAGGCRELWLQGEIYLFLGGDGLVTNSTEKKYDLYKRNSFVMEVKLLGGNYQRKVLNSLAQDFEKVSLHEGNEQKYVLLVLDNRFQESKLYDELFNYQNSLAKQVYYQDFGPFCILLWRVI
ncbi:hypothetical protein [Marinobacter sp. SS5-14b]|jgi:hypothetical protein|uniref:hypothetical protein n=1 Tax=Marinobacter sp. SS5-14b TaxID=3050456 RepID=UPI0026E051C6|nr:hypothetical protein [Marinobacter sp. SS5-14b]|tara:strand:+ start:713 stop:1153 length:441 start_codon:yes stop_codon:yes gene_type:complete